MSAQLFPEQPRVVVWFSCGAASAVALHLAKEQFGARAIGVYCDLSKNEDADNVRFRREVEQWTGVPITVIRSEKFETVDDVIEARQYLAGTKGAPCTVELKKIPRFKFQRADDLHVFGFTHDEKERIATFSANNHDLQLLWNLRDRGISKADCYGILKFVGITLPLRYLLGFKNNNCEACVKASSLAYWVLTRQVNPKAFARRAEQSRRFGARLTRLNGKRIFLDEIPPDAEIPLRFLKQTENISCGPECGGKP